MEDRILKTVRAAVLGHAVADALGVPVEFSSRAERDADPVREMRGYGSYPVPAGAWSDDTSMALCALDSLAEGTWDLEDVLRRFALWYTEDEYTPTGEMFDDGGTCSAAIEQYLSGTPAVLCGQKGERSVGNGALMRLYPFVLWAWIRGGEFEEWEEKLELATALTHAHPRAILASGIYARVLFALLRNPSKEAAFSALREARCAYADRGEIGHFARLLSPRLLALRREEITSSGYAVATLEASLWCLFTTESYREAVERAVNLGDDTDTVAAVTGALAGVLYGEEAIPAPWLAALLRRDFIGDLAERFASAAK